MYDANNISNDYGLIRQVVCEDRGLTLQGPLYNEFW